MIEEILPENIPTHIQYAMLQKYIDILLEQINEAGVINEFFEFIELEEVFNIKNIDDLAVAFAKKYPDKFYVVPENQRVNKAYYVSLENDKL